MVGYANLMRATSLTSRSCRDFSSDYAIGVAGRSRIQADISFYATILVGYRANDNNYPPGFSGFFANQEWVDRNGGILIQR